VNFTEIFRSPTLYENLDRSVLRERLLLSLHGLGTNTGLKRMAGGQPGTTYKDLLHVRRRFVTREHLREAITRVVIQLSGCAHRIPRNSSAWDQNLMTEWHIRYGGQGVMIYWHVEKRSYSQLKTCSSSEVAAMIEGGLRHCTEMEVEKNYVDTHGCSRNEGVSHSNCRPGQGLNVHEITLQFSRLSPIGIGISEFDKASVSRVRGTNSPRVLNRAPILFRAACDLRQICGQAVCVGAVFAINALDGLQILQAYSTVYEVVRSLHLRNAINRKANRLVKNQEEIQHRQRQKCCVDYGGSQQDQSSRAEDVQAGRAIQRFMTGSPVVAGFRPVSIFAALKLMPPFLESMLATAFEKVCLPSRDVLGVSHSLVFLYSCRGVWRRVTRVCGAGL
jgi:Tn3 transposase DDE domain